MDEVDAANERAEQLTSMAIKVALSRQSHAPSSGICRACGGSHRKRSSSRQSLGSHLLRLRCRGGCRAPTSPEARWPRLTMFDDKPEDGLADDAADQQVARVAEFLIQRFGREAPLRAELAAQDALAVGNVDAYRVYKRAEGVAEETLFEQGDR